MEIKGIFQEHPNHSYLVIDLKYIVDLGLENLISRYSFYNDDHAFLEEDSDALLFMNKSKELGYSFNYTTTVKDYTLNSRHLNRFVGKQTA